MRKDKYDEYLGIKVSRRMRELIEKIASKFGLSKSEIVRMALFRFLKESLKNNLKED